MTNDLTGSKCGIFTGLEPKKDEEIHATCTDESAAECSVISYENLKNGEMDRTAELLSQNPSTPCISLSKTQKCSYEKTTNATVFSVQQHKWTALQSSLVPP